MANEFRHGNVVSGRITEAEYEAVGEHIFNSQATGDILYASSGTQLSRLGVGTNGQVLALSAGIPAWSNSINGLSITNDGTITTLLGTAGDYVRIGDGGTTSHGFNTEDDLLITSRLEVNGITYLDASLYVYGNLYCGTSTNVYVSDDMRLGFGYGFPCTMLWETADANANEFIINLPTGGATDVPVVAVGVGIETVNLGFFDGITIPTLALVAADRGGYWGIGVADDDIIAMIGTTTPVVEVDETKFSHKLQMTFNGATYYVMLTQT